MTNILLFPKKEEREKFILTNSHIDLYVNTIQDAYYLSEDLDIEDLKDAVRISYFYAKQMQKRINELEDK